MNQPILQVVIPAYGESPYLYETLKSATKNLSPTTPITVLEDPSESSNVADIVKEFSKRVKYIKNEKRLGIGGNFNKAIEISAGIFTLICGSDDLIKQDLSNALKPHINQKKIVAFITEASVIDGQGEKISSITEFIKKIIGIRITKNPAYTTRSFLNRLMIGYWFYFPGVIWRTEIIKKEKFSNRLHSALDLEILIRLLDKEFIMYNLRRIKITYRRHNASQSSKLIMTGQRFKEEFFCHDLAKTLFKKNNWWETKFLIYLAISIRLHILLVLISNLFKKNIEKKILGRLFFRDIKNLNEKDLNNIKL